MSKNKNATIEDSRISFQKFEVRYGTANKIIDAIKWLGLSYFGYKAVHDLAGKLTLANFNLSAVIKQGEESDSPYILYIITFIFFIVAAISIWYGRREARLRKNTIASLTKHIEILELQIDPNRTSSMLTARGDTAERDRR